MAVSETLETNEAMTLILQQLKQVIDYDSASIQLLDGNELEIVAGSGYEDLSKIIGVRFPIPGDNPNSIVINTGKPYTLSDAGREHASFSLPPHDHIRSWLGVPLIVQDTIIGLLSIDSAKLHHFTKDSQNIAREFADQVAIVLKNTRLLEETRMLAIVDPLTGLYNRRGLLELGKIEFGRSNRLARPFSGIMLDIDHFKEVNDSFGHDAGDSVLEELARRCKKCLREIDLIGRYGGEEFVALLPETDFESSLVVAERLRSAISTMPIQITDVFVLNITASLGVAHKDENTPNLETLIARADQAMYIAKHRGRDRVARST
jgi:diguanylate cyclase (GGDEF)-like protein